MKSGRHAKILEIINAKAIETQDELLDCLSAEGRATSRIYDW